MPRPETCQCAEKCGRPVWRLIYSKACYERWTRAGRPEDGPPPPMPQTQRRVLGAAAYRANNRTRDLKAAAAAAEREAEAAEREAEAAEPDAYELAWLAGEPERRAARAKPIARDLIRCVAHNDAAGIGRLLRKVGDWTALAIVLAECADPARTLTATAPCQESTNAA